MPLESWKLLSNIEFHMVPARPFLHWIYLVTARWKPMTKVFYKRNIVTAC